MWAYWHQEDTITNKRDQEEEDFGMDFGMGWIDEIKHFLLHNQTPGYVPHVLVLHFGAFVYNETLIIQNPLPTWPI